MSAQCTTVPLTLDPLELKTGIPANQPCGTSHHSGLPETAWDGKTERWTGKTRKEAYQDSLIIITYVALRKGSCDLLISTNAHD